MIKFQYKNTQIIETYNDYFNVKITIENYKNHKFQIKQGIKLFNSEITWDSMWTYKDSVKRLENGCVLYLMIKENNVIGFVWYNKNFLYNLFVTKHRIKGDSQDFVNYTINDVITQYPTIECECDDWNVRAHKFFEGLGFIKIK